MEAVVGVEEEEPRVETGSLKYPNVTYKKISKTIKFCPIRRIIIITKVSWFCFGSVGVHHLLHVLCQKTAVLVWVY